ncbi:unnamed protein product [Orchesella dallaii]|uniref:Gustatory receptor n=1 Tax=Orchesella dallaii TaxID=48710 RepID=A0ABP1RSE6_9HEXA
MAEIFLYAYFKFAYFLLLVPYKFMRNPKSGIFHVVEWMPQKVLCGVSHVVILFLYCVKVQRALVDATFENHISIFTLFEMIFSLLYKITLVKTFWVKKETIQGILNSFNTDLNLNALSSSCRNSWIESLLFCNILLGFYSVIAITRLFVSNVGVLFMTYVPSNYKTVSFSTWYFNLKYEAKCTILLQQPCVADMHFREAGQVFTLPQDGILLTIIIFIFLSRSFMAYLSDVFVLMIILTLSEPVKKFTRPLVKELERENMGIVTTSKDSHVADWVRKITGRNDKMVLPRCMSPSINTLVERYEALKRLSFKLNNVVGAPFLFYLGEAVITYAIHLYDRLELAKRSDMNPVTTVVHFLFYVTTFLIFFTSSEICRQMNFFKSWLFDKRRSLNLDMNEFFFLLDSLASKVVSISAFDVVTMSYSMIGTFLGLILTFFIVSLTSPQKPQ